jgi:hypothetical protein
MANQPEGQEDLRWLLEPPAPGAIKLYIAVGEGTELTPEARDAIETLTRMLEEQDTQGFAAGPRLTAAGSCSINCLILARCNPEYQTPCAMKDVCNIIPCPDYTWSVARRR